MGTDLRERTIIGEVQENQERAKSLLIILSQYLPLYLHINLTKRLRNNAMKTAPSFCLLLSLHHNISRRYSSIKPRRLFSAIKSNNYINMSYEQDGAEAKEIAKYLRKWQSLFIVFCCISLLSMIDETRSFSTNKPPLLHSLLSIQRNSPLLRHRWLPRKTRSIPTNCRHLRRTL